MAYLFFYILLATAASTNCYWITVRPYCTSTDFLCFTLDRLATIGLISSYNLRFETGNHYLNNPLTMRSVEYFTMQGTVDSIIVCNGSENYWFIISSIYRLVVSQLTFINCSGITYFNITDLSIVDTVYLGCQNTSCLYIENSTAAISNVKVRKTVVWYNFFFNSSIVNITNITVASTNSIFSLFFYKQCNAWLQSFNSDNSSGIVLGVVNSSLDAQNLQFNSQISTYCRILHSIKSVVTISYSSFQFKCTSPATNVIQSHLHIVDTTFLNTLNNSNGFSQNLDFLHYGTALKANSSNVTLLRTKFFNCSGYNGGAVEIITNSILTIKQSTFSHNLAELGGAVKADRSTVLVDSTQFIENEAWSRGGAINAYSATVIIKNSVVTGNKAWTNGGGGLYLYNNSLAHIHNTDFSLNSAIYGGALAAYQNSIVEGTNTSFDSNIGYAGGPIFMENNCTLNSTSNLMIQHNLGGIMFIARSHIVFMGNQVFHNNSGSMGFSSSEIRMEGTTKVYCNSRHPGFPDGVNIPTFVTYPYTTLSLYASNFYTYGQLEILNNSLSSIGCFESTVEFNGHVILVNNSAVQSSPGQISKGGGITAYQSILKYYGRMDVENNSAMYGGGLYASTTINQFYNPTINFHNNHAERGGAVYMDLNSKLIFDYLETSDEDTPNPQVEFKGNQATDLGGAIFVNDKSYFGVCSYNHNLDPNPEHECFIQYSNLNVNEPLTIKFKENIATFGSILYGGLLNRCTLSGNQDVKGITYFRSISSIDKEIENAVTSKPVQLCIQSDEEINCTTTNVTLKAFKGETIALNMTALDQVGISVEADIYASLSPGGNNNSRVNPGQLLQTLSKYSSLLKYNIHTTHHQELIQVYPQGPCINEGISNFKIYVTFEPCPPGFWEQNGTCICHENLQENICDIDTQSIIRQTSQWISHASIGNESGLLLHSHCPSDYCYLPTDSVTINLSQQDGPDSQCAFNRSGTLCGRCKEGLSLVLGSSECQTCSSVMLLLVIPLGLGGIAIVLVMFVLNLTVEAGLFNGLIIFANIVDINYSIFFPPHSTNYYSISSIFIKWINMNLGFQTCFYDGMDMYSRVWLEILSSFYFVCLSLIIVSMRHRINTHWIATLFRERKPYAVLATLLLLTFNKFIVVLPTIYSYATLVYPNGERVVVWLADGNVRYMDTKHVILMLVGLLLVTYVAIFIILLLSNRCLTNSNHTWVNTIVSKLRLRPLLEAYQAPYASGKCFWPGVLLLYRVVIMLIVASTRPDHSHKANLMLFAVATFFVLAFSDIQGRKYLLWNSATLETVHLTVLGFLAITYLYINDSNIEAIVSATIISSVTILGAAVITYHIYKTIGELHITKQAVTCLTNRSHKSNSEAQHPSPDSHITTSDIATSNTLSSEVITTTFIEVL